jgi:hypothetical protein
MLAMSEVDVTKELMTVEYFLRSEENPNNLTYGVRLLEWTPTGMVH